MIIQVGMKYLDYEMAVLYRLPRAWHNGIFYVSQTLITQLKRVITSKVRCWPNTDYFRIKKKKIELSIHECCK